MNVPLAWPAAGRVLFDTLEASRDRLVLVFGDQAATDALVDRLVTDLGFAMVRLGGALAPLPGPPTRADIAVAIGSATVVADLDCLLWPDFEVPLLPFLADLSRQRLVIAVWPGDITNGRARYSAPGRPDHYNQPVTSALLLRPRTPRYPDEVPYDIERITQ